MNNQGKDTIAVGIDLGTTYCCIAVLKDDEPFVVPNGLGKETTPSYISFQIQNKEIGEVAKEK